MISTKSDFQNFSEKMQIILFNLKAQGKISEKHIYIANDTIKSLGNNYHYALGLFELLDTYDLTDRYSVANILNVIARQDLNKNYCSLAFDIYKKTKSKNIVSLYSSAIFMDLIRKSKIPEYMSYAWKIFNYCKEPICGYF